MMNLIVKHRTLLLAVAFWVIAAVLSGCAHPRPVKIDGYSYSVGEQAAEVAGSMVGTPYRYGGNGPTGFDCSGLVQYSYAAAGIKNVPHSTKLLRRNTRSVHWRSMREGDILFFKQRGKSYSHVGIYVGDRRFVHAPSTGKTVRTDSLEDSYWRRHFLEARRFL